jgi:hypothetical protein
MNRRLSRLVKAVDRFLVNHLAVRRSRRGFVSPALALRAFDKSREAYISAKPMQTSKAVIALLMLMSVRKAHVHNVIPYFFLQLE